MMMIAGIFLSAVLVGAVTATVCLLAGQSVWLALFAHWASGTIWVLILVVWMATTPRFAERLGKQSLDFILLRSNIQRALRKSARNAAVP